MNRRALIVSGLMVIGFAAALPHSAAASEKTAAAVPLEVTYYYLPT